MAKYYGTIGFSRTVEVEEGVWKEKIFERQYFIDVLRNSRRISIPEKQVHDISIDNEFSIIADPFARENFHAMRYIEYMGTKWTVESVEVLYPRLNINVGGLYNGEHGPRE